MPVSDRDTLEGLTPFRVSPVGRDCNSLILNRRDVRVVEGARLEIDSGDSHQATPKHYFAHSMQRLAAVKCSSTLSRKHRDSSAVSTTPYTVSTQFRIAFARV